MSEEFVNKNEILTILRKRSQQLVGVYGDLGGACSGVAQLINEMPSADRPSGEWERIPYSFAGGYRCSICGQKSLENHWNYCPNCGARMKGADDE